MARMIQIKELFDNADPANRDRALTAARAKLREELAEAGVTASDEEIAGSFVFDMKSNWGERWVVVTWPEMLE